jgi:hypothetical protein
VQVPYWLTQLKNKKLDLRILNKDVENVEEFVYLGSPLTWDNDCSRDIRTREAKNEWWKTAILSGISGTSVMPQFPYHTDDFAVLCLVRCCMAVKLGHTRKQRLRDRIRAFEMYYNRRILGLSWIEIMSNKAVRKSLNWVIKDNLMQVVIKRKLGLFVHICTWRIAER